MVILTYVADYSDVSQHLENKGISFYAVGDLEKDSSSEEDSYYFKLYCMGGNDNFNNKTFAANSGEIKPIYVSANMAV